MVTLRGFFACVCVSIVTASVIIGCGDKSGRHGVYCPALNLRNASLVDGEMFDFDTGTITSSSSANNRIIRVDYSGGWAVRFGSTIGSSYTSSMLVAKSDINTDWDRACPNTNEHSTYVSNSQYPVITGDIFFLDMGGGDIIKLMFDSAGSAGPSIGFRYEHHTPH